MTADAVGFGQRTAQAAGRDELILGLVAPENLPDLEQRHVGIATVGIALRRRNQPGEQARPHIGQFSGDRIGQGEFGLTTAEQFGLALRYERPRHRFGEPANGQRALGLAGADLDRRQHGFTRIGIALERCRGHAVDADDAHQLFDDVGAAMHVGTPTTAPRS